MLEILDSFLSHGLYRTDGALGFLHMTMSEICTIML